MRKGPKPSAPSGRNSEAERRDCKGAMGDYCDPRTDHMTDYELIMIMLTFLTLLIAVERKNSK